MMLAIQLPPDNLISLTGRPMALEQKRLQDFLNFEFDLRLFNCSVLNKGCSGFIGERNSIYSTDMKYNSKEE